MSVTLSYDDNQRLLLDGIACDCGLTHQMPDRPIHVGRGLLARAGELISRYLPGTQAVLVADDKTWPLAGREVCEQLRQRGFKVDVCLIRRDGEMLPDETACGEVLLTMTDTTDFLISVGSGSLTDTTRIAAMRTGKPFAAVATAPSMDGYTSVVAPLLLRGSKIHRQAHSPDLILCDLDILRQAPMEMIAGGVGDVLGKYIAITDWRIGQEINDEAFCPLCAEMVIAAVDRVTEHIDAIISRSEAGIRLLTEALLLAGLTIMIIGHTRAVASVEHNIVHLWDMMQLARGRRQPPHGLAVGLSTLMIWPVYTLFAADNQLSFVDPDAVLAQRISHEQRAWQIMAAYGEEAGRMIIAENPDDFLTPDEQRRRIDRARERWPRLRDIIADLPPYETIINVQKKLQAPRLPQDLQIEPDQVSVSLRMGKDYRSRYSLFKLLDDCGLLETFLATLPWAKPTVG
ncbi:MAG: sn-glycerol-1-phosphate dehydrogenase [Eubacteriales bacterium]|nr:sn-glycerol-1-phosphate dehydrogenase [Eubacteriales bacterium]